MEHPAPRTRVSNLVDGIVARQLQPHLTEHFGSLGLDDTRLTQYFSRGGLSGIRCLLFLAIRRVYPGVPFTAAKEMAVEAADEVTPLLESSEWRERAQEAFVMTDYLGDGMQEFAAYLERVLRVYRTDPKKFVGPCVALVQSSGFGKTRLLFELARDVAGQSDANWRLLYSCVQRGVSTGFPEVTASLNTWLFADPTVDAMADRLVTAYLYAMRHWSTVGNEWLDLFLNADAGVSMVNKLAMESGRRYAEPIGDSSTGARTVVLVVDGARTIFPQPPKSVNRFQRLRNALVTANAKIESICANGGLFAVLVDTDPLISMADPLRKGSPVAPPPFVLTHPMDVHWCERNGAALDAEGKISISTYRSVAMDTNPDKVWDALLAMGRPLWKSLYSSSRRELVTLAAKTLMRGNDPCDASSYNPTTMDGAASMVCRLGLRPHVHARLTAELVGNFMATLAYVKYKYDGLLVTYRTDPMLALGATRVWYALDGALEMYVLPQLKSLLLERKLATNGAEKVVARILLLLAMDTYVVAETGATSHSTCEFTGQYVNVQTFLEALGGEDPPVKVSLNRHARSAEKEAFEAWRSHWHDWKMHFSRFEELDCEPNENTLWYLLGRCAAGVFPEEDGEACLLIPIIRDSEVAVILVQIHADDRVRKYYEADAMRMRPWAVFSDDNPLSKRQAICIHLNMVEPRLARNPNRFFLSYSPEDEWDVQDGSFALCIRSLQECVLNVGPGAFPVVSNTVAAKLAEILRQGDRPVLDLPGFRTPR